MNMNNSQFLDVLKRSFIKYLETSERSNEKLKILHGEISNDIIDILTATNNIGGIFTVSSLGYGLGKEKKISGRYMDKAIDITISRNSKPTAGIAVKYVMSNYMQNSNNYFENMLGETANIRCADIPYFQIFIIADKIPYFKKSGVITKWERINEHNLKKYIKLSEDSTDAYMHTPNKTLVCVVNISGDEIPLYSDKSGYKEFYLNNNFSLTYANQTFKFSDGVIYNNYEEFIKKIVHAILSF